MTPAQERLARNILGAAEGDPLSPAQQLGMTIYELLLRLKMLEPEARIAVFTEMARSIDDLFEEVRKGGGGPLLAIADGRYVTWTGRTGWYDTVSGASSPGGPFVETVAYHLGNLYRRSKDAGSGRKAEDSPGPDGR